MSTKVQDVRFTYQDYLLLPDDGKRHELIDGDHYMTPAPYTKHQRISSNLPRMIGRFVYQRRLGRLYAAPTAVLLSDLDVVQPDLLFVSTVRTSIITEKHIQGPPDLVIEILSDATRKTDEIIKRKLYERYGVSEYWIVDPVLETVKIYHMTDRGYVRAAELTQEAGDHLSTSLFPDLTLMLTAIFE